MTEDKEWWARTAKDFFDHDCESGGIMVRADARKIPHAVIGTASPETLGRMIVTAVAVYALGLRDSGKVDEETIKRVCETIGEVVFKASYSTSKNLTLE